MQKHTLRRERRSRISASLPFLAMMTATSFSGGASHAQSSVTLSSANTQNNILPGARYAYYGARQTADEPSNYWVNSTLVLDDGQWVNFDHVYDPNGTIFYAAQPLSSRGSVFTRFKLPVDHFHLSYLLWNRPIALSNGAVFNTGSNFPYLPRVTDRGTLLGNGAGYTFCMTQAGSTALGYRLGSWQLDGISVQCDTVSNGIALHDNWSDLNIAPVTVASSNPGIIVSGNPVFTTIDYDGANLHVVMKDTVTGIMDDRTYAVNTGASGYFQGQPAYFGFTRGYSTETTSAVTITNAVYSHSFAADYSAYWPVRESSGSTVSDIGAPGGNTLTLGSGAAITSAGRYGHALTFTATPASTATANNTTFGNFGQSDFSTSCWINSASVPTQSNQVFLAKRSSSGGGSLFNAAIDTTGHVFAQVETDAQAHDYIMATGSTPVCDGKWHLISVVRHLGNLKVYVDGILDANQSSSTPSVAANISNTSPFCVGYLYPYAGTTSYHFAGGIDDVRVYSRALSTAEILGLYNAPIAQWSMDENGGSTLNDSASMEANQTLGSTVAWSDQGAIGGCLSFNGGAGNYSNMTDSTFGNFGASDFTISSKIKVSSVPPSNKVFICKRASAGGGNLFNVCLNSSGHVFAQVEETSTGGNFIQTNGVTQVCDGNWHTVTVVRHLGDLKIYVDGALDADAQSTTPLVAANIANTAPLSFGYLYSLPTTSSYYFVGSLDDVQVYSRALTGAEIAAL